MPNVAVDDKLREECGVLGIFGHGLDVVRLGYFGLFALQHRGQESAGLAVADGTGIVRHRGRGLVAEAFNEEHIAALSEHNPHLGIGHVRYSTAGASDLISSQPLLHYDEQVGGLKIALAHNGNLVGAGQLRRELEAGGAHFATMSDTEVILKLLHREYTGDIQEALVRTLLALCGAFSLVLCTPAKLIGVRDPHGFRPLCLGSLGGGYILASESAAILALGGEVIRDIRPGEIVVIDDSGVQSQQYAPATRSSCIFEYVYFARNDSVLDGLNVYNARVALGRRLAEEHPVQADLVISVPDSGTPAALGYAASANLPYGEGLVKNRYVGRTFIQSSQALRELKVLLKFTPNTAILQGQRVVIVDDSIVRGTTMELLVRALRRAGASEVHVRVSCPPYTNPCYFGIDTPSCLELVANCSDSAGVCRMIGADSLGYLSLEGMLEVLSGGERQFCLGCFTGDYPLDVSRQEQEAVRLEKEDWGDVRG
ncbi:MAG: amidophosphoribosyltransferase [Firmicutes bacterium]|nr:amidophosphoribosyltransferase [Dethiobacter sp.]MBS3888968.1 amidophosphoribosyltransferase [Bacillota bacterium]